MGYPEPKGTFPRVTPPSATHPEGCVRLACVKPAASVRSEPGSNSQVQRVQSRLITTLTEPHSRPNRFQKSRDELKNVDHGRLSLNCSRSPQGQPPPTLL